MGVMALGWELGGTKNSSARRMYRQGYAWLVCSKPRRPVHADTRPHVPFPPPMEVYLLWLALFAHLTNTSSLPLLQSYHSLYVYTHTSRRVCHTGGREGLHFAWLPLPLPCLRRHHRATTAASSATGRVLETRSSV